MRTLFYPRTPKRTRIVAAKLFRIFLNKAGGNSPNCVANLYGFCCKAIVTLALPSPSRRSIEPVRLTPLPV